jgi:hypothetical protein
MDKITGEVADIVKNYNRAIEEVRLSNKMIIMENELEFFRKEALTLFEQNKYSQEEIKRLKYALNESK